MGFKPDLDDQLVSLVPKMTYIVLSGTLINQPTFTITLLLFCSVCFVNAVLFYVYTFT